jgi:hypothetical protein
MAYIGKQPIVGNFVKLDAISATATTTFNLLNGGVAYYPQSANNCLVSLNGILQAPTDSYTISGSTIIFSSALTTSDVIDFIIVLGDVLNIGTPSDNTVTAAKIVNGAITSAKLASGVGGKVLQVVSATDSTSRATSSTSFVTASNTLSLSITPSSSSNKIYLIVSGNCYAETSFKYFIGTIYRDATDLGAASSKGLTNLYSGDSDTGASLCMTCLDSPSTTSAITYQVYFRCSAANNVVLNENATKGVITAFEIAG